MKKLQSLIQLALLIFPILSYSQTTADFENFGIEQDTFLNGSSGAGGFNSGHVFLPNNYNQDWGTFSGWAISSMTDTQTPGFTNQFSSIAGQGAEGSTTYATAYVFDPVVINMTEEGVGVLEGVHISNSTYAYLSMRDGDAFAKKFGGITGDDPDFLLLTIKRWWQGITVGDDIEFYLADFRSDNNSEDYILDDWSYVSFDSFKGNVDSVELILTSSDIGDFGMNTPAYICMDNFITSDASILSTDIPQSKALSIAPNPVRDNLVLDIENLQGEIQIMDAEANVVRQGMINDQIVDVSALIPGYYTIKVKQAKSILISRFLKI